MMFERISLSPTDCLKSVQREYRARKSGVYVLFDKHGDYLIVSQRLHLLSTFLNSIAPDPSSRISVSALYEILDNVDNRVGGFSKHRWACRFVPLDTAASLFESERVRFQQVLILGTPNCYSIECAS